MKILVKVSANSSQPVRFISGFSGYALGNGPPDGASSVVRCPTVNVAIQHLRHAQLLSKVVEQHDACMAGQPLGPKADVKLAHFSDYLEPVHLLGASLWQAGVMADLLFCQDRRLFSIPAEFSPLLLPNYWGDMSLRALSRASLRSSLKDWPS
jgi:hypothetical protein